MHPLIGEWRTRGEIFAEDGRTVESELEGSDVYEWLGPTVVHHVDVMVGGTHTRALEVFEPFDPERGVFPTRAYDDQGGAEDATATVHDGVWTFVAGDAEATLTVAGDGARCRPSGPRRPGRRAPALDATALHPARLKPPEAEAGRPGQREYRARIICTASSTTWSMACSSGAQWPRRRRGQNT